MCPDTTRSFVFLSVLASAAPAIAAEPTPVEVAPVDNTSSDPALDLVAERLTDTLRRALGASGRFTVVRSDLADEVRAAQRRYLSQMYAEQSAPEVGEFLAAKVLVKSKLRRQAGRELEVSVSFVDVARLAAVRGMDLVVRAPEDQEGRLRIELAIAVAERAGATAGAAALDAGGRRQVELLAGGSGTPLALDEHTQGRREARRLTYEGLRAAVAHFEAAVRLDPDFAVARADLARALTDLAWIAFYVGETDEARFGYMRAARAQVARAQAIAPESSVVLRESARVYARSGYLDLAQASLRRAKAANPNDPGLLVIEARMSVSYREKVAKLERAIALDPHDVAARFELGLAHADAGRRGLARAAYLETLRSADPRHPVSLINLAWELPAKGKLGLARRLLTAALDREPRHGPAHAILGLLDDLEGRSARARLRRAIERAPEAALQFGPPPPSHRAAHEQEIALSRTVHERYPDSALAAVVYATKLAESAEEENQARAVMIFSRLQRKGHLRALGVYGRYLHARALGRVGGHAESALILEALEQAERRGRVKVFLQLQLARALAAKADYSRARTVLTKVVEQARSETTRAAAQIELSRAYRDEGELDLARRVLERAGRAPGVSAWVEVTLGSILAAEHTRVVADLRKATEARTRADLERRRDTLVTRTRAAYARALERAPNSLAAFAGLARFCWRVGDRDAALEAWARAAELDRDWLPTLASKLHAAGRTEEAEDRLNAATAKDPGSHALAFYRGEFFTHTGQTRRAAQAYADAFHLRPSWGYVTAAATAFGEAGEHDRGVQILKEALRDDGARASGYHNRIAVLEAARDRLEVARRHLLRAHKAANGQSFVVLKNLAVVYTRQEAFAKAERAYEDALVVNPAHSPLYLGYAELLESQDAIARAREVLARGLEVRPRDRTLRLGYARRVAFRKENCDKAIEKLQGWAVDDPGFGGYARDIGRCRLRLGDATGARAAFTRATRLSPRDPDAFAGLAQAHEALGHPGAAWGAYSVAGYLDSARYTGEAQRLANSGGRLELPEHAPADYLLVLAAAVVAVRAKAPGPELTAPRGEGVDVNLVVGGTALALAGVAGLVVAAIAEDAPRGLVASVSVLSLLTGSGMFVAATPGALDQLSRPSSAAPNASGRSVHASAAFSF